MDPKSPKPAVNLRFFVFWAANRSVRTCRNLGFYPIFRVPCDCWYTKLFTEPFFCFDAFWWSLRPKSTGYLKNLDFFQFRATIVMIRTCHNQELSQNIRKPCDCWYTKLFTASFHFFGGIPSECVPKCSRSKSAPGPNPVSQGDSAVP